MVCINIVTKCIHIQITEKRGDQVFLILSLILGTALSQYVHAIHTKVQLSDTCQADMVNFFLPFIGLHSV